MNGFRDHTMSGASFFCLIASVVLFAATSPLCFRIFGYEDAIVVWIRMSSFTETPIFAYGIRFIDTNVRELCITSIKSRPD